MKKLVFNTLFSLVFITIGCFNAVAQRVNEVTPPRVTSENGILVLSSPEAYIQAMDFFDSADDGTLNEWRNSFEIETSAKALVLFETNIEKVESVEEVNRLEEGFRERIKITDGGENGKNYDFKYRHLAELTNQEGIFKVGGTIIKVTNSKIISVTHPDKVEIESINDETRSDQERGIFVTEVLSASMACCPTSNAVEKLYNKNNNRLQSDYELANKSIVVYLEGLKQHSFSALLALQSRGFNDRKRKAGFVTWWWGTDADLTLTTTATFTHDYVKFGIPSPLTLTGTSTVKNKSKILASGGKGALWQVGPNFSGPPDANFCISSVNNTFTNNTDKQTLVDTCKK